MNKEHYNFKDHDNHWSIWSNNELWDLMINYSMALVSYIIPTAADFNGDNSMELQSIVYY